ncbi:TetR/AcrR family transcriptional regulator [Halothermothrix orenii]|uniref:Transcriptional regulator, TetR family n=1 Tax=Halothermothrix orenii (strain H 168 / OCM 544 / DSM 9562) TaxID=373903 RepID=B8CWD2_HALOH|nr:TetR/AcrR family transcriptional regulator [Halothermothrix orenii]ACL69601.1 transcriptional regulator, TetR family [Halothermothrix orenii H 168]
MKIRENKKELIREAAIKVISKFGFYNTTTASIAEEAGVAVGTIYNYFTNKEEILEYIFAVEFEKRMSYLKEIAQEDRSIYEKIELFLEKHFMEVKENPSLGKILVREKDFSRKKGNIAINEYLNKLPLLIEEILNKSIEKKAIEPCNTYLISTALFGAIQGIVERAVGEEDFNLFDQAAAELVKILKEGI